MSIIIKNIDSLVTCEKKFDIIENGFIVIEEEKIKEIGQGDGYKKHTNSKTKIIDGKGKTVTPGLIDSHTHVVYSGSREKELKLKLSKVPYMDILSGGGGILSTVKSTREATLDDLVEKSKKRLNTMLLHGTTTIESKSGYALDFHNEIKMLKANKALDKIHPIDIVSTYLGAHAIPMEYKENRDDYINLMKNDTIPYIAKNHLAEFIDCFCEKGVFTVQECKDILSCGKKYGLKLKIHADEMESINGAELAGNIKATSADHLIAASDMGIQALADHNVTAVLLPTTSFYLMLGKYADARKMIDNGVRVALATDCNPGTSPTESLQTVMTFACFGMGMTPKEIIEGVTINGAYAIGREEEIGSLKINKQADVVVFDSKNLDYLIYHFGVNMVDTVIKNGKIVVDKGRINY